MIRVSSIWVPLILLIPMILLLLLLLGAIIGGEIRVYGWRRKTTLRLMVPRIRVLIGRVILRIISRLKRMRIVGEGGERTKEKRVFEGFRVRV